MRKIFTLAAAVLASLSMWATATNFHTFVASGDTIIDLEGTGSTPSAKFTAVNNTDWAAVSTSTKNQSGFYRMDPATEEVATTTSNTYGSKLGSSAKSTYKVTGVSNVVFYTGTGSANRIAKLDVTPDGESKVTEAASVTLATKTSAYKMSYALDPSKSYTLEAYASDDIFCYAVKFTVAPTCTAPASPLVLDASKKTNVYVGDVITFSTSGGNGGTIALAGANSEVITDSVWTATEGTHTFTASQAKNGDYCAQESQLVITVAATTPVTAANVEGPTAGYVGDELTYTVTAANATDYEWYVDGVAANTNAATFKYTAVLGSHTIYATATNSFTATPVQSNSIALTVTKVCGVLATGTTQQVAGGHIASAIETNLSAGTSQKMDKNKYFGLKLTSSLQAGDTFAINITAAADLGNFMLYADKAGTQLVYDGGITYSKSAPSETGIKKIVLPAAATGIKSIYLYRAGGSDQWNVTFDSIGIIRPCSESSDATISEVYVNVPEKQVFTQDADTFYFNIPYNTGEMTEVNVYFAFNHPAATANISSPFVMNIPAPGQKVEQNVTVTAEDGTTTKTYVIRGIRNAALNNDATLKSLSVDGFTLAPAFASNVYEYTITKAYGAQNPGSDKIQFETTDPSAHGVRGQSAQGDTIKVEVTAEDDTTQLTYSIAILEGAAKKDLLKAIFANGANGYIANGNINVPYLAGETVPALDSVAFWNADGEPTYAVVEGNLVVTGVDSKTAEYTITYVPVTPLATLPEDTVTFDSTEVVLPTGYIYTVYGWDASKGVKFAKDVEDASNHRISEGKDRIYLALPAAKDVVLVGGSAGARSIQVTVNGVVDTTVTKTPKAGEEIKISLAGDHANFVGIESNGNNGDAGFIKMFLTAPDPSAIINTADEVKAVKVLRNGQLFIEKNGVLYNAQGVKVIGEK